MPTAVKRETFRQRLLDPPPVFAKGHQSWNYEAHFALEDPTGGAEVVRVRIERDSYVRQSSARLDIYDPGGRVWNELARLYPTLMAVCQDADVPGRDRVSYVHSAERLDRDAFVEDAERLLAMGELVLTAART